VDESARGTSGGVLQSGSLLPRSSSVNLPNLSLVTVHFVHCSGDGGEKDYYQDLGRPKGRQADDIRRPIALGAQIPSGRQSQTTRPRRTSSRRSRRRTTSFRIQKSARSFGPFRLLRRQSRSRLALRRRAGAAGGGSGHPDLISRLWPGIRLAALPAAADRAFRDIFADLFAAVRAEPAQPSPRERCQRRQGHRDASGLGAFEEAFTGLTTNMQRVNRSEQCSRCQGAGRHRRPRRPMARHAKATGQVMRTGGRAPVFSGVSRLRRHPGVVESRAAFVRQKA